MNKKVVMVGPGLKTPGGMTTVIQRYYSSGIVERLNIVYLSTYEASSLRIQVNVMFQAIWTLTRMLMKREVAAVHVNSASRGSFWRKTVIVVLAKLFNVKTVFHLHSGEFEVYYDKSSAIVKSIIRWVLRSADEVICLSQNWLNVLSKIEPAAAISIIGNPVDIPDRPKKKTGDVRTALFFGRLRVSKGVYDLLDAIPVILKSHPDVRFILAGDDGEQSVREYAERLGISHAVVVPGWVSGRTKQELLDEADLFLMPSHFEALGMSILEAMAARIPVLATDVGGIPDLIDNNVHGILVPKKNPGALAAAFIELCETPDVRERLADSAYTMVCSRYASAQVMSQLEDLYSRLGHAASPVQRAIDLPIGSTKID